MPEPERCETDADCREGFVCEATPLTVIPNGICVLSGENCVHPPAEGCSSEYAPVCGGDGVTYGNRCEASLRGIEVVYEGECREIDPEEYCTPLAVIVPLCGVDGVTYDACAAASEGIRILHEGPCEGHEPEEPPCPRRADPVCGVDGISYENACFATQFGIEIAYNGVCNPGPSEEDHEGCASVFQPVCGADGLTYENACVAEQSGIEIVAEGECRD